MTPEEQSWVLALAVVPGGRPPLSGPEFLEKFGATDGAKLGCDLLRDAVSRRDAVDTELSLIVCFRFGLARDVIDLLIAAAFADWHQKHEDIASALGKMGLPDGVDALMHLATTVPEYLEFDDARALASKAIWALSTIPGHEARRALERLTSDPDERVARLALKRLKMPPASGAGGSDPLA